MILGKLFNKWLEMTYAGAQGRFKKITPHRKVGNSYQLTIF